MTTIAVNSNVGNRRVPKEKKTQSNKVNVAINSVVGDTEHNNHSNDKIKTDSKLQPTAEQIRIANLMNDNRDDLDLKDKIEQIIELTGSTRDEAVVALHDCDNDTAKAIDMILEGDSLIESDWRTTGKKKKPPKTNSGDDSKPDMHTKDSKFETNKDSNRSHQKSEKTNNRITRPNVGPPRLQRAALANKIARKPKEFRNERNEVDHNNDIFSTSAQQIFRGSSDLQSNNRRGDRRGGVGRGTRGGNRGFGNRVSDRGSFSGGRGSRTFQNRGLSNDGFNTIDTWTNSTADQSSVKTAATDCNTMTVGNWSDIAANEDWSEEDWDSSHMETKVFTPSTKALAENDELLDVSTNIGANSSASQPLNFSLLGKPSVESSQHSHPQHPQHQHQSMSSILSANISRSANVGSGAALLQQLQQSSSSQSSTLNQYSLSQYNKQATESIKSLVGLPSSTSYNSNSDLLSSSERDLSNSLTNSQSSNLTNKERMTSRMKVSRSSSKIPESAVEMPTNDSIAALGVQFGALEFGTDNSSFTLDTNSVFQDAVNHVTKTKKSDQSSSLSSNSMLSASSDTTYRPSTNSSINDGKVGASIIQNSVISHQSLTSDSLLDRKNKSVNVGPYGQKVLDTTGKNASDSYSSVSPQQNVNDMTSNYKNAYSSTDSGVYNSVTNYSTAPTVSYPYSSNSQSGVYGNQVVGNYASNFAGSSITNHSSNSTQKLRDMDNNSQQKQYDISSAIVTNANVGSLGLISNSTVTTNVLKNTLSASKGLHSVPPGVATPVLSTPYIMSNPAGLPIYPFPYDVQFQAPPTRDHNFATYAPQDVKYSRGSDSDVTSVSTSQTGAASQTHNQTFVNNVTFPPGYGFYFTPGVNLMTQSMYGTAAPIYPVTPAANTGSAGSAFSKSNTGYGSHSYNSSYDPITAVAQTQDYVKQGYGPSVQHPKGLSGSNADLSTANSAIYGKTHTQMTKSYDKQSFQTSTPPPFNLNASAQSAASAYGTPYILPHNQASLSLHHALQADANQTTATAVSAQRSMSQTHKGSAGSGSGYAKYNWS